MATASEPMTGRMSIRGRDDFDARLAGLAALGDPVRRALYRYVVDSRSPVNRDQAAEGVGVARHVAKFHLDKLVDEGLLETEYARPAGRGGPGAGRPAKLYRRAARELQVSLPARRYDLAGSLLARAVASSDGGGRPVRDALAQEAASAGHALGVEARARVGARPSQKTLTGAALEALARLGYEPDGVAGGVELANCPFHALATEHTDLVCAMNRELVAGVLAGLGHRGLDARLEPAPGRCCVRLCELPRRGAGDRRTTG